MGRCKKKLDAELEINFPAWFGQDINHIDKLREFELLKLKKHLGEDVDKTLEIIYEYFISISKPKVFNPYSDECVLVENDKQFEEVCNSIQESGLSVSDATVFEFYSKIKYLEKRSKKK